jgi:hypothetical protein
MKTENILIPSVITALGVGFGAGHFQASYSLEQDCCSGFYMQTGGEALWLSAALQEIRGGNEDAGITKLETHLELALANLESLPVEQRDTLAGGGIREAQDYCLKYPWHGSVPAGVQEAADKVLASAK